MDVCFDSSIAKEYGINVAVILNELCFLIEQNKENNVNFYDGKYWVLSSIKDWSNLLDYMTINTIRRTLKRMEKDGLIVTGNYNQSKYDRTKWYALSDKVDYVFRPNEF